MILAKVFFIEVGRDLAPDFVLLLVIWDLRLPQHQQLWQKCHKIEEKISPRGEHHSHVHRYLVVNHINLFRKPVQNPEKRKYHQLNIMAEKYVADKFYLFLYLKMAKNRFFYYLFWIQELSLRKLKTFKNFNRGQCGKWCGLTYEEDVKYYDSRLRDAELKIIYFPRSAFPWGDHFISLLHRATLFFFLFLILSFWNYGNTGLIFFLWRHCH